MEALQIDFYFLPRCPPPINTYSQFEMRRYGINIPYLILSHPEIVGEDMISWTIAWEMHFMKAIQVFMTKRVERWIMGQEADTDTFDN